MGTAPRWEITSTTESEINRLLSSYTNSTPGVAVGIYRGGEIAFAAGYGLANLEHSIPITPDSVFYIASVSKQFTAMCIALLVADGRLDADTDIRDFFELNSKITENITVRHLVHHTSGLREYFTLLNLAGWRDDDVMTNSDVLNGVQRQHALTAAPNTEYRYCNTGYVLLSLIVEQVSGMMLRQFAQERVFGPLGMTSTHFQDNHAETFPGRTHAYKQQKDGAYTLSVPMLDVVGDGGLYTTINDMAKWNANFTSPTIADAAFIDVLQTPGVFANGELMDYAWGMGVREMNGVKRFIHGGSMAGYRSHYLRIPELEFGVAVFANSADVVPASIANSIAELVLVNGDQAAHDEPQSTTEKAETPDAVNDVPPEMMAGIYRSDSVEESLIIDYREDGLSIDGQQEALALHLQDDGTYTQKWGHFSIIPTQLGAEGQVQELCVHRIHKDETQVFSRVASPEGADYEQLTGCYYSQELDTTWEIQSTGSASISVQRRKHSGKTYRHTGSDEFTLGGLGLGGTIRFQRKSDNIVAFDYIQEGIGTFRFTLIDPN